MNIPSKYKAICFDVDNTLLKTELNYEALRMSIPKTIIGLGADPTRINAEGIEFVKQVSIQLKQQGKDLSVQEILQKIAADMLKVEMSTVDKSTSFPGTVELLEELKNKGLRLGILTNGFRQYVDTNMGKFDLAKHFEVIVSYDDLQYGQQKPSPDAMMFLAKKMDLKPEEILYVGDSVGDYRSAVGAGAGFVAVTTGEVSEEKWKSIDKDIVVLPCIANLLD